MIISFIIKKLKLSLNPPYDELRDRFFRNDTSFYPLINTDINNLYERCRESGIKFLKHDSDNKKLYFNYRNKLKLVTDYTVGNILEMFAKEEYKIPRKLAKSKTIVFDIGMNKGFSSLYYAQSSNIVKVIGFEIDPRLLPFINENIEMNKIIGKKIEVNTYGLAKSDGTIDLHVLQHDDGVTTMNKDFYNSYWGEKRREKGVTVKAQVKKASEILKKYINEYPNHNFILQIDAEGAEYEIIKDLHKNKLMNSFDIISGEVHDGYKNLSEYFKDFKTISYEEKPNTKLATFILQRLH